MAVVLILVDGMRPDALAGNARVQAFMAQSACTLQARTVMPSVTLPCHMSLFHSVDPDRHGTTTNVYTPQVRPIQGLCEVLRNAGRHCAFFYNWEQLRDLTRPGSLEFSYFFKGRNNPKAGEATWEEANDRVTDAAIGYLTQKETDFSFIYLGYVDEAGHKHGWMTQPYMQALENSWKNIDRIVAALPEDTTVIVTADHGGHDRIHGTKTAEDMTIPVLIRSKHFPAGNLPEGVNIKDLAPTVATLLGVCADDDWEGASLL